MKTIIVYLLIFSIVEGAIRFADDEMMRKHHNHHISNDGPMLTVHLIPHSHDDVGWLKTVDDYYYGDRQDIQWAGVQYTIDTVVQELAANPTYKFSIVEMAFLYRWWNQATQQQKDDMKRLVANKQIVFINGGWCMSDEANVYYEDFIDNMVIGLRWLKDTFNEVPDAAWHIDPFGHQASAASMFSRMGFNSFFFSRIDYQDKNIRLSNKALEMVWRPNLVTPDPNNYIFTHVNYYHYSPPPGFCFDQLCRGTPIRDDPNLQGYNLVDRSTLFANYFQSMSLHFKTNNLMHTMGEDFTYSLSRMWYKNMDKLMNYINSHPEFNMKIIYSNPVQYIKAIQLQKQSYPPKNDDFFPYADNQNSYWTGYFTSRTAIKGFVRDMGRFTQLARKHISQLKITNASKIITDNSQAVETSIWALETAMGILQHHDAVAGTEKQRVADDYVATGLRSIQQFNNFYRQVKKEEIFKQIGETVQEADMRFNVFWNQTASVTGIADLVAKNKSILVSFFNPGPKGLYNIKLRVPEQEFNIISLNGLLVGDVVCPNLKNTSDCELLFELPFEESSSNYVKLQPMKSGTAKIVKFKSLTALEPTKQIKLSDTASIKASKNLGKFDLTLGGVTESFMIGYSYYKSYQDSGQKSGAYIFRPSNNTPLTFSSPTTYWYADGVQNAFFIQEGTNVNTKLYFSKAKDYVNKYGFQVQSFIGSISIKDNQGKEVVMTYSTPYQNTKTFYTDSNGLQEQKRIIDFRPTWPLNVTQPVAGNYYPINSHISIIDTPTKKKVTLINDRSQGASVMNQGVIEIMVNRRTTMDDSRGVGEPLSEVDQDGEGLRQSVRHYVVYGENYRTVQRRNDQRILPTIHPTQTNTFVKNSLRKAPFHAPDQVKVFYRPFTDGSYLVRLHNMDTKNQNTVVFNGWTLTQYTLAGNQLLENWRKNQFKWNEDKSYTYNLQQNLEELREQGLLKSIENMIDSIEDELTQWLWGDDQKDNQINEESNDSVVLKPFEMRTFKMIKV